MRVFWRTFLAARLVDAALLRDISLMCLADGIVGASFGATAVAGGLPWWVPVALSVLVFAGGSQFAAIGVVIAGGSPAAAVAAGAVLNTRLFPYGLAVADVVRGGGRFRQLVASHLITDEAVAFTLRQPDQARRNAAFWASGAGLFTVWNVAVVLGVLAGSLIKNTDALGLDAMFPAVTLALALPTLTTRPARLAAGTGAAIAVALTPVLPAGLPLLAALGGLTTRWRRLPSWLGEPPKSGHAATAGPSCGAAEGDSAAEGDGQADVATDELTTGSGR